MKAAGGGGKGGKGKTIGKVVLDVETDAKKVKSCRKDRLISIISLSTIFSC